MDANIICNIALAKNVQIATLTFAKFLFANMIV